MNMESFEDIKVLMDEFDPAALLPDLTTLIGKVEFVTRIAALIGPIVLLVMGLVYLFLSPKEANHYFGYRCYHGMGSVEAWRFTQRLAGIVWGGMGLVLLIVMLVIRGGYEELTASEIIWSAAKAVLWQAGLALISVLCINSVVTANFTAAGEFRRKKEANTEEKECA